MANRVRIVAVQAELHPERYRSPEAFVDRTEALVAAAVEGAPGPTLVAFPELYAMPLLFTAAGVGGELSRSLPVALATLARRRGWRWLAMALRHPRSGVLAAPYRDLGVAAHRLWVDTFSDLARRYRVTLVAGSALLPTVGFEAARGWHAVDDRVHNVALLFGPNGALLARSRKVHLTAGLERRIGLRRGSPLELPVVATPVGRVAIAVCLDGWYHPLLEQLDGQGAQVLVQPSANPASWSRRWPADPRLSEGEAWLQRGLALGLQRRAHLRYAINPMLVGGIAPLAFEGVSTLWTRVGDQEVRLEQSAPDPAREALVIADVPHPDEAGGPW